MKSTVGLGILSWRSHETLNKTLDSYEQSDLFSVFDESLIYFNAITDEDESLASRRGMKSEGGENLGIAGGMEQLARRLNTKYVLLVQNDCPLVESQQEAARQLAEAVELLERDAVQLMRMRHQFAVGEGFSSVKKYLDYFDCESVHPEFRIGEHPIDAVPSSRSMSKQLKRLLRPTKARRLSGRSIYVEQYPERLFPDRIERIGTTLAVDSSAINFTDQSILVSREFFLDTLMRRVNSHPSSRTLNGFQVPEICLNCRWWRQQHFRIGQARGLFTHNRFDGSFRPEHAAYQRPQSQPEHAV